jgi:glutathione S-transferase
MLKVWGRGSSFNVQKVLWLVGELGLPHEHISAGGDFGGLGDPGFLAMNPHGRVPTIDDDGVVVWESHTILRYLAAKQGGAAWWPEAPC